MYAKDRIEVISADELAQLDDSNTAVKFKTSWLKPQLVSLSSPTDSELAMRISVDALNGGSDLAQYPVFYIAFESQRDMLLDHLIPIKNLSLSKEMLSSLHTKQEQPADEETLLYLPVTARTRDGIAVFTAHGELITLAAIQPIWPSRLPNKQK
ncbi:MAG: hypothetical protein ACSHXK_03375 [Oceanococcus sp.]